MIKENLVTFFIYHSGRKKYMRSRFSQKILFPHKKTYRDIAIIYVYNDIKKFVINNIIFI